MMRWFGPSAEPPFPADDIERVPIPDGVICARCDEPITASDFGVLIPGLTIVEGGYESRALALHDECHVRDLVGSVEHQMKSICDRTCSDDPALTTREAAKAAAALFRSRPR